MGLKEMKTFKNETISVKKVPLLIKDHLGKCTIQVNGSE